VYDGPIFERPVAFRFGERVYRSLEPEDEDVAYDTGFWYLDLVERYSPSSRSTSEKEQVRNRKF